MSNYEEDQYQEIDKYNNVEFYRYQLLILDAKLNDPSIREEYETKEEILNAIEAINKRIEEINHQGNNS
ncbi:MAG: hypothetical protein ACTSR8_21085 [Promethearchaeota archaeon]